MSDREQMKIVIVGHVDHGKSTLIGRLFHDTDSLPDGKYEQIKSQCEKRGMPFEWSFLLDSLQAERDQGITIDTTQIWFKTKNRDYVIIDAPGHKEFLKNMVSGAANSEAAILVIDAKEGVREQSKRHAYLLSLLDVTQLIVAVNKMDSVDYSEDRFNEVKSEIEEYLKEIGVKASSVIPVSAREGDLIVSASENISWYDGDNILNALDNFKLAIKDNSLPLRFPVQDVYKFDDRRIVVGRIESGVLKKGDEVLFSPSNKSVTIATIETFGADKEQTEASAGMSVGVTLSEQIFVERGNVISHLDNAPILSNIFYGKIFWLGDKPLKVGNRYNIKIHTSEHRVEVVKIVKVIDAENLAQEEGDVVHKNNAAEVVLQVKGIAAIDEFIDNPETGRFVLMDNYRIVGGGTIEMREFENKRQDIQIKSENIYAVESTIDPIERYKANGHKGGVLWFSGLSGSGKTTLALELQQRLFDKGYQVFVLDGDNVRHGLNNDLGFSPEDRSENIRRVGEVAALFADSGVITIAAFISPYKTDRDNARVAAGDNFHSIYINADLETCEERDPKGLYKKARKGEIKDFTGIDAPYEEPDHSDLIIDTGNNSIEECVQMLTDYIDKYLVQPIKELK